MSFLPSFPPTWVSMAPWLLLFGVVIVVLYLVDQKRTSKGDSLTPKSEKSPEEIDPFYITPLPDFDWRTTEPLKFRTFKPKYHLTLGLTNTTLSNLITLDYNYLTRVQFRTKTLAAHPNTTIDFLPAIIPSINELYTWLVTSYLPTRFPTLFQLRPPNAPTSLFNTATSLSLPLTPSKDPRQTLTLLGQNLDEDILLLLPSEDGDGYRWNGHVICCAAGFNPAEKFGLKLRDVHGPVPGYKQKLERSMDRYFERLEVGKVLVRSNWMIQTNPHLYGVDESNHLYEGQEIKDEEVDIPQTYFRAERQTLHRLPETKAVIFMYKTYMSPISQLKEEGNGEELAQAIDGLREGSVPGMWIYKRGVVWGERVKEYLRS